MKSKKELMQTPEYWVEKIQNEIFAQVDEFMKANGMTQSDFARHLGVSKGYVSQIVKGDCNFSLKKLVELSLALERNPTFIFSKGVADLKKGKIIPVNYDKPNRMHVVGEPKSKYAIAKKRR